MASAFVKSNRMKRLESKKTHSCWWDSHISPKNCKWLQENLEEMDQNVKRMLKLIEEDADSFAKKAELYFKKRPELISLVDEFYRIYRTLAERYANVTGELRKNIPSDLHSQSSGISDAGSEPPSSMLSPDRKPSRTKSGPRAAGFDFFLGSDKSGSDRNSKEGDDESSTLDSDTESDANSSVNNYSADEHGQLRNRIGELEIELQALKEKAQTRNEELYEEELRVARENTQHLGEEIIRLTLELQKYKTINTSAISEGDMKQIDNLDRIESKQNQLKDIQASVDGSEPEAGLEHTIQTLEVELRIMREKICESEEELTKKSAIVQGLQDQLNSAHKEIPLWKNKLDKEKREVSKLLDRMTRYKNNLSDRDQEIRALKEAISNANKSLSEENDVLKTEMKRLAKERAYLEDNLKELDLRCQSLEEDVRRANAAKAELQFVFGNQIELLKADISVRDSQVEDLNKNLDELKIKHDTMMAAKDDRISQIEEHLHQLHLQHVELIADADLARRSAEELASRVEELEKEVQRKRETILEGEEGKREAIRQLCFSIEHYRAEYDELRRVVMVHKRPAVMAA